MSSVIIMSSAIGLRSDDLRSDIDRLEKELSYKKQQLNQIINNCNHKWSNPLSDNIYTAGYTDPGDEPGTMGVDWRGPCYVPPTTEYRWKRVCFYCGKTEHTTRTNTTTISTPKFD